MGFWVFCGLALSYMVRCNLSIAIVAMAGTSSTLNNTQNQTDICPVDDSDANETILEGDFDWDGQTQGLILGAFFWGYTATNFVGGRAAEYFGARLVFGLGVIIPSALALFSVLCAFASTELFIALRVLQGLTQAALYPSLHLLLSAWVPPQDKGSYCAVVFSGAIFGTILSMSIGGWLCNSEIMGGWPSVFYIFGGLGVIWGLPWFLLSHDLPEQHPSIKSPELNYIMTNRTYASQNKRAPLPIREICSSVPFWTLMIFSLGYNFAFYTFLTMMPTYFSNIQHFDLSSNGLVSALPYVMQLLTTICWGGIVSILSNRNLITVAVVRKLSSGVGMYGSAAALVAMMFVECNSGLAMAVMCLSLGMLGMINSGAVLSEQDIAPNFTGSLKGITNTIGAATGILAPTITGAIIDDNQTLTAWRQVFGLTAFLNLVCCTGYMFFSTVKVQPWNNPKPKTDTLKNLEMDKDQSIVWTTS